MTQGRLAEAAKAAKSGTDAELGGGRSVADGKGTLATVDQLQSLLAAVGGLAKATRGILPEEVTDILKLVSTVSWNDVAEGSFFLALDQTLAKGRPRSKRILGEFSLRTLRIVGCRQAEDRQS
jgi:hypothetical protein